MKIAILGTGDLTKIPRFTKFSSEKLKQLIKNLGKLLAEKGHEIVIIPDRGVPVEVAKVYCENKGKKIYGVVPVKDKRYSSHVPASMDIIDKKIPVNSWYDADGEIAASGDITIAIGMSPGIMREVMALKFHYKYLKCKTKFIWFKNTISRLVPPEIEEEIPITYIKSIKELEEFL